MVWYDPRGEFQPYIAELQGGKSPAGCVVEEMAINDVHAHLCIYDGSFFEVRAAVEPVPGELQITPQWVVRKVHGNMIASKTG